MVRMLATRLSVSAVEVVVPPIIDSQDIFIDSGIVNTLPYSDWLAVSMHLRASTLRTGTTSFP